MLLYRSQLYWSRYYQMIHMCYKQDSVAHNSVIMHLSCVILKIGQGNPNDGLWGGNRCEQCTWGVVNRNLQTWKTKPSIKARTLLPRGRRFPCNECFNTETDEGKGLSVLQDKFSSLQFHPPAHSFSEFCPLDIHSRRNAKKQVGILDAVPRQGEEKSEGIRRGDGRRGTLAYEHHSSEAVDRQEEAHWMGTSLCTCWIYWSFIY